MFLHDDRCTITSRRQPRRVAVTPPQASCWRPHGVLATNTAVAILFIIFFSAPSGIDLDAAEDALPLTIVHRPDAEPDVLTAAQVIGDLCRRQFGLAHIDITARTSVAPPHIIELQVLTGLDATGGDEATSQQAIRIRTMADGHLLVAGGSPRAVLWGAYELGFRWGDRYTLLGDLSSHRTRRTELPAIDVTLHPIFTERAFHVVGHHPFGFQFWPAERLARLMGQLVKLRFTHVVLDCPPFPSAVPIELLGVKSRLAPLAMEFDLSGEIAGRKVFGGRERWGNLDLLAADPVPAGATYLNRVAQAARQVGLAVELRLDATGFPAEFGPLLEDTHGISIARAANSHTARQIESQLFGARREAYRVALRDVEQIAWARPDRGAEWMADRIRAADESVDLAPLRTSTPFLSPPDENERLVLRGTSTAAEILPHTRHESVARLLGEASDLGWHRVALDIGTPAETSVTVSAFARASWRTSPNSGSDNGARPGTNASPAPDIHTDWVAITGNRAAADRIAKAWRHLALATQLVEQYDPDLGRPSPELYRRHFIDEPVPAWWEKLSQHYSDYVVELYRARGAVSGPAVKQLFYMAKRGEFANEHLAAIRSMREAGIAGAAGETEEALEALGSALESIYNGITSLADVARSPSDRTQVALLNQVGYQSVLSLVEEWEDQ